MRLTLDDNKPDPSQWKRTPTDEELKELTKKHVSAMRPHERLLYYLDTFKIPIIVVTCLVLIVFFVTKDILSNKPDAFYAEMINAGLFETDEIAEDFAERIDLDLSKENCRIDDDEISSWNASDQATIYTIEKLAVHVASADLDAIAADEEVFGNYASEGTFRDLREILTESELEQYADRLVEAVVLDDEGNAISDPAPYGIRLDDSAIVRDRNAFYNSSGIIGILVNSSRPERAVAFVHYLIEG